MSSHSIAHSYAARMSDLAESFPALRGKPGVTPWEPELIARWSRVASHGEACAARFVLAVWVGFGRPYPGTKRFDLMEAMGVWDEENKAACAAWIKEPFWP